MTSGQRPGAFKLGRDKRLLTRAEFDRVFKKGKRRAKHHPFVAISIANESDSARLGIAVAKRNVRRAVDRNRVKRAVRESFRTVHFRLISHDLVIVAGRGAADCTNVTLARALEQVWNRLESDPCRQRKD